MGHKRSGGLILALTPTVVLVSFFLAFGGFAIICFPSIANAVDEDPPPLSVEAAHSQKMWIEQLERIASERARPGTPEHFAILRRGLVQLGGEIEAVERGGGTAVGPLEVEKLVVALTPMDSDPNVQQRIRELLDQGKAGTRIVGGLVAKKGVFPETVAIVKNTTNTGCSGVLIAQDIVMTAGHCVCNLGLREAASAADVGVMFTENVHDPNIPLRAIDTAFVRLFHATGKDDDEFCPFLARNNHIKATRDIAVFRLKPGAQPNPAPARVSTPDSVSAALSSHTGNAFIAVGFGASRRGSQGVYKLDEAGQKKYAFMPLSTVCGAANVCTGTTAGCVPCLESKEFVLFDNAQSVDTCGGDSGGPIFVQSGFGTLGERKRLAGITSRSVDPNGLCGPGGVYGFAHTREVKDWLRRNDVAITVAP